MESLVKNKWVLFRELPGKSRATTQVFDVCPIKGDAVLGQVKWYGPWRKYAFFPMPDMLFDTDCMKDIVEFINKLMLERKLDQQNRKLP